MICFQKPAAQHEVGVLPSEGLGQTRNVGCAMLAIRVKGDDHIGPFRKNKYNPALRAAPWPRLNGCWITVAPAALAT